MRKKAKKNTISDPPSHPPSFRALLSFRGAVVEELGLELGLELVGLPSTVALPFKEFSPLVVEGDVGSESAIVGVDIIVIVVEGLTRVVPEVAVFGVVGIVVGELTRVVLDVGALEVVGTVVGELTRVVLEVVALEVVETGVVIDIDIEPTVFRQGRFWPMQEYPGSQHES